MAEPNNNDRVGESEDASDDSSLSHGAQSQSVEPQPINLINSSRSGESLPINSTNRSICGEMRNVVISDYSNDPLQIENLPNEILYMILQDAVWSDCRERYRRNILPRVFYNFNQSVQNANIPERVCSPGDFLYSSIETLSRVCRRFSAIMKDVYLLNRIKSPLINADPCYRFCSRPVRLRLTDYESGIIDTTLTSHDGRLYGIKQHRRDTFLISYATFIDYESREVSLYDKVRVKASRPIDGDVMTMWSAATDDRLMILSLENDYHHYVVTTITSDGDHVALTVLSNRPSRILPHDLGLYRVEYTNAILYHPDVYDSMGHWRNAGGVQLDYRHLTDNVYSEEVRRIIASYPHAVDSMGCVVLATDGRSQLLNVNGRVILPRHFTYEVPHQGALGTVVSWLKEEEGILFVRDFSRGPEIFLLHHRYPTSDE